MKVIDLLNKIANGEEVPKRFIYDDKEFYLQSKDCWRCDDAIFEECFILEDLNKEVEIIKEEPEEDKKIEKFKVIKDNSGDSVQLVYDGMKLELTLLQGIILDKINEIIDYLKENR